LSATATGNLICITDPHPVFGYGRIEAAPEGAVKRSGLSLSPRRARGFHTTQKLAALIGFRERVPRNGRSEAALRTYGETILFDPPRRVIDPAQQIFDFL
jgi:hypothetical protein